MRGVTIVLLAVTVFGQARNHRKHSSDVTLWIDEKQVKEFSGFQMEIFAIVDGVVLPYILDSNFERYLPVIPSDVTSVNFTWKAGDHKKEKVFQLSGEKYFPAVLNIRYFYDFNELKSYNESILSNPLISISTKGKIPRKARVFQVFLPCLGNQSGIVSFVISLRIQNEKGFYLPGTPLRLRLQKQCADHGPDPECDKKCANGGRCNPQKICECPKGYMGKYCRSALCYPQCMNGGTCTSPGICSCADGYQGPHCEGGMCREKCVNGGKCVQKDSCLCRRGYYGSRCEFSKCSLLPCLNGGRCIGLNVCRCRRGYTGKQCETVTERQVISKENCKKKCVHGICRRKQCACDKGWFGKRCSRRKPRQRRQKKQQQR